MTFGLAADFSEEAFVGRLNADLANDLGNLVARATTLIVNYQREAGPPAAAGLEEAAIREAAATARGAVEAAMEEFAFHRALRGILGQCPGLVRIHVAVDGADELPERGQRPVEGELLHRRLDRAASGGRGLADRRLLEPRGRRRAGLPLVVHDQG